MYCSVANRRASFLKAALAIAAIAGTSLLFSACEQSTNAPGLPPTPDEDREFTVSTSATVIIEPAGPEAVLARVQVSPDIASVAAGQRFVFTAIAFDAAGKPIPQAKVEWKAHPEAGRISSAGLFASSKVPGIYRDAIEAKVTHRSMVIVESASVEIVDPAVSAARALQTVAVYPASIALLPGQVAGLSALGWDEQGQFVQGLRFTWSVADPRIGQVDRLGFFTAGTSPGVYPKGVSVTAIQETAQGLIERQAFVAVTVREQGLEARILSQLSVVPNNVVLAPGQRVSFLARAFDQSGRSLGQITYEWAAVTAQAGRIEHPGQFVAGQQTGRFENAIKLTATQSLPSGPVSVTATVSVTVQLPPARGVLATARITPGSVTAQPGQRFIFSSAGFDAQGKNVPVRVSWSMEDSAAGSITQTGIFVAGMTPGVHRNAVKLELVQDQDGRRVRIVQYASVSIVGKLAKVEIVPDTIVVVSEQSIALRAIGYDDQGLQILPLRLRWSMVDPKAGRIESSGIFTASAAPGTYQGAVRVLASDGGAR